MFFLSQLTMEYKHYYSYVAYLSKVVLEDPLYKSCKNICSVSKVLNMLITKKRENYMCKEIHEEKYVTLARFKNYAHSYIQRKSESLRLLSIYAIEELKTMGYVYKK
jgi:hypothetical protein